ncbi:hypothetical protein [Streptococcus parasuis]|uniref:hypothetical protein n=1 Tax=Streptococcus parasuis TaxID=1501662 RepID=UPI0024126E7D|nr:hypothetical protein [Streptococcus parasuis]MDG4478548.1 hypothetical protein [Streptococcus parasuis]
MGPARLQEISDKIVLPEGYYEKLLEYAKEGKSGFDAESKGLVNKDYCLIFIKEMKKIEMFSCQILKM